MQKQCLVLEKHMLQSIPHFLDDFLFVLMCSEGVPGKRKEKHLFKDREQCCCETGNKNLSG